jgi:hypothetical protein
MPDARFRHWQRHSGRQAVRQRSRQPTPEIVCRGVSISCHPASRPARTRRFASSPGFTAPNALACSGVVLNTNGTATRPTIRLRSLTPSRHAHDLLRSGLLIRHALSDGKATARAGRRFWNPFHSPRPSGATRAPARVACRRGQSESSAMVGCAFVRRGREFDPALESTSGSCATRGRHISFGISMAAKTS